MRAESLLRRAKSRIAVAHAARVALAACVALGLVVALLAPVAPVRAWCRMTTSQTPPPAGMCPTGIPLEWTKPCSRYHIFGTGSHTLPLTMVRDVLERSFSQWETVECGGTTLPGMPNLEAHLGAEASQCDRSEYVTEGPNVSTVVFVDDWAARDYDPSAYAVTTVWHSTRTGEIYDVDMEINEDGRVYTDCSPAGCADGRGIDLQNVVTHEAGHYFGIAHTSVVTATMFSSSPPGEIGKRLLEPDDIEALCTVYPPGRFDGAVCDDTPRGGATLTCGVVDDGCGCSAPGARGPIAPLGLALLGVAVASLLRRRRRITR